MSSVVRDASLPAQRYVQVYLPFKIRVCGDVNL